LRLARLKARLYTAILDLRYGGSLRGKVESKYRNAGAHATNSTPYDVLPVLFENAAVEPSDVLVDVGSGKGRVLNWWLAQYPKNKIVGIELDPEIAAACAKRLSRFNTVTVIAGDACELAPESGTVFFLFNPFAEFVVQKFIDKLLTFSPLPNNKSRRIIYYGAMYTSLFSKYDCFRIKFVPLPDGFHDSAIVEYHL
jgi:protein-L-isoaspartate O-methyltransferase